MQPYENGGQLLTFGTADTGPELGAQDGVDLVQAIDARVPGRGDRDHPDPTVVGVGQPGDVAQLLESVDLGTGRRTPLAEMLGGSRLVDRPELGDVGQQAGEAERQPERRQSRVVGVADRAGRRPSAWSRRATTAARRARGSGCLRPLSHLPLCPS